MAAPREYTEEEYPISDDGEEEQPSEEEIKEALYQQYLQGRLAEIPADQVPAVTDEEYPVGSYTGGGSYLPNEERRLTPSQSQMRYLLHSDDVPATINKKVWAIVSRHLELIDVPDWNKLPIYHREIRDIIRCAMWRRDMKKIPYSDIRQVEFYSSRVLLPKSLQRGERMLLATQITRQQVEEYGERTPGSSPYGGGSSGGGGGGFIGAIKNLLGQFSRGR